MVIDQTEARLSAEHRDGRSSKRQKRAKAASFVVRSTSNSQVGHPTFITHGHAVARLACPG
jgi:hypothetical protein